MEPRVRITTRAYGTPSPVPAERSAKPRLRSRTPAVVEVSGHPVETMLWDAGPGSASVDGGLPVTEGQRICLRVSVPRQFPPLEIDAEVRWVQRRPGGQVVGCGVRFDGMRAHEMRAWLSHLRSLDR